MSHNETTPANPYAERDRALRAAGVHVPPYREDEELEFRPRFMVYAHRRYGFFWAKRCEDAKDELHYPRPGCVPAFCGLITPWFAVGIMRSVPDWCLTWNDTKDDEETPT